MNLINGKFFENGIEIKPEFGNKEQIALIQKQERLIEQLKTGVEVYPEYTSVFIACVNFTCICGHKIYTKMTDLNEFDGDEVFNDQREICHKCNRRYQFNFTEGDLIVKLIK